jgi:hypothetical protein
MDLDLKSAIAPILNDLRADGHRLRGFVPELPDALSYFRRAFFIVHCV